MKRILSLILVLLLSLSLSGVCVFADDAVSAENAVPADAAASAGESGDFVDVYDISLLVDRVKDAFERCHRDEKTLKILRKANWNKTDDMLRSELAACIRQHDQLKVEIEGLIPDEMKEYFHGENRIVPADFKDAFSGFKDKQELYNEKMEAILTVQGEIVDLYLELYNRGLYTKAEVLNAIDKLALNADGAEEGNAPGTQMAAGGSQKQQVR